MSIDLINTLVRDFVSGKDLFAVETKITPGKILVAIDKPTGVTIEECVELNRFLYQHLEDSGLLEKHELEVGSPGMDQPLKVLQQYHRRIGRTIKITTTDGQTHTGLLQSANNEEVVILETVIEKIGKKKSINQQQTVIPFVLIKETKLEFKIK
jgi:ribosome maturation factor RimP